MFRFVFYILSLLLVIIINIIVIIIIIAIIIIIITRVFRNNPKLSGSLPLLIEKAKGLSEWCYSKPPAEMLFS